MTEETNPFRTIIIDGVEMLADSDEAKAAIAKMREPMEDLLANGFNAEERAYIARVAAEAQARGDAINGTTAGIVITDDVYDYDINDHSEAGDRAAEERLALNAGFYEAAPSKPITIPTYRTFHEALMNTTAIQTISRRG